MSTAVSRRKEEEQEPKADDLEIISIGWLYRGPWDKKYWSCSRGKDRYPYPVGYHATRLHEGNTCKMEIHEGSKGPLFVITSANGSSCSGQTPTMVWDKFQKQGVSRMKIWHGKRFSCKIDGIEFFGFKNPFVQRLLRELVADVNGIAEQILSSPSYCNGPSETEKESECRDLCPYTDLLAFLSKPLTTGKRGRRHEKILKKSERAASSERLITQHDTKVTYSRRKRQKNSKITQSPVSASPKENIGTLYKTVNSSNVLEAYELLKEAEEDAITEENTCKHAEISRAISIAESVSLDRLHVDEVDPLNALTLKENINEEAALIKESEGITDATLFVDDTMDELQEDEPTAATMDPPVAFVTDSHPEELATGSSENSELDSVGQEIAKTMMTVLLPQALPLLKKGSKKKRERKGRTCTVENSLNNNKPRQNENIDHSVNVSSPGADVAISRHAQENWKNVPQGADVDCAVRNPGRTDNAGPEISGNQQHAHADLLNDLERRATANIVSHGKLHTRSDVKLLENNLSVSGHSPHHNFHYGKLNSERSDELYASMGINPISSGIPCEELKVASVKTEGKGVNDASVPSSKADDETRDAGNGNCSHIPSAMLPDRKNEAALPERIVHSNSGNSYLLETCPADGKLIADGICDEETNNFRSDAGDRLLDGQRKVLCRENSTTKGILKLNAVPFVSENQTSIYVSTDKGSSSSIVPSASTVEESQPYPYMGLDMKKDTVKSDNCIPYQETTTIFSESKSCLAEEGQALSHSKFEGDVKLHNELKGILQLVGCYSHPLPVLSVLLRRHGNEIYLCVQCGQMVDEVRTLLLYKLLTEKPRIGCPSFIGQTLIIPPISDPGFGGITPERTCFQLTPDGQSLILLGNVKTPYCRERRISCSCSTCAPISLVDNAVRIVRLNTGYVTVVVNLKTADNILSILVCEPSHLVAAGESGRLHLWIMNPTWSGQIEEFDLPTYECVPPGIVELKKVPKHASLLVSHNGFGEFTVWDLSRRICLAKFTAPSTLVHCFLPISSLSLRWKGTASSKFNVDENINEIMAATMKNLQECDSGHTSLRLEGEEIAIWLLVSALSDAEDDYQRNSSQVDSVALWRLGLLAKNAVILGTPLYSRASAIAALSGYGVIGTRDGFVYLWELSTGAKLGTLHHFKGNGVSCIATDDSTSSILGVCGGNGELMVYQRVPSQGQSKSVKC